MLRGSYRRKFCDTSRGGKGLRYHLGIRLRRLEVGDGGAGGFACHSALALRGAANPACRPVFSRPPGSNRSTNLCARRRSCDPGSDRAAAVHHHPAVDAAGRHWTGVDRYGRRAKRISRASLLIPARRESGENRRANCCSDSTAARLGCPTKTATHFRRPRTRCPSLRVTPSAAWLPPLAARICLTAPRQASLDA